LNFELALVGPIPERDRAFYFEEILTSPLSGATPVVPHRNKEYGKRDVTSDRERGMLAAFDLAFSETLGFEGGYSNDPDDGGNWTGGKVGMGELKGTMYGISAAQYPDLDIPNLTREQAKAIYYRDYWQPLKLDSFVNPQGEPASMRGERIAREIFDTAVNMGVRAAAYIAQRAINFLGEEVKEDGVMGAQTLEALSKQCVKDAEALFKVLNGFQFMYYYRIITRDPDRRKYARGWMRRIQGWSKG
jgi:lysozyme family protein